MLREENSLTISGETSLIFCVSSKPHIQSFIPCIGETTLSINFIR